MLPPRYLIAWLLLSLASSGLFAQSNDCNALGVWLWHVEDTGFTHELLANNLATLGVKRVYTKVADGGIDSVRWPELVDTALVSAYHDAGLEVWAWSYNYDSNKERQAAALYRAAQTGYDGYVVDVEMEFDGKVEPLRLLFEAFDEARQAVLDDGIAQDSFLIYCTTWGNPKDHNYSIESIDPYVDAYMPQTYVEYWGPSYVDNISYWIREGNKEYELLGATKPIHHIASTATGVMTPELIDEFILASGPETSLWRIPGAGVSFDVWQDWGEVSWTENFCLPTSLKPASEHTLIVYPNPTFGEITIEGNNEKFALYNKYGIRTKAYSENINRINLDWLLPDIYFLRFDESGISVKVIKL